MSDQIYQHKRSDTGTATQNTMQVSPDSPFPVFLLTSWSSTTNLFTGGQHHVSFCACMYAFIYTYYVRMPLTHDTYMLLQVHKTTAQDNRGIATINVKALFAKHIRVIPFILNNTQPIWRPQQTGHRFVCLFCHVLSHNTPTRCL